MLITTYFKTTGEIIANVQCKKPANYDTLELGYVAGTYDKQNFYFEFNQGLMTPRPQNNASVDKLVIAADFTEIATIANVPNPTIIRINGEIKGTVVDGTIEFKTDTPGEYRIQLSSFPAQDKEIVINAD